MSTVQRFIDLLTAELQRSMPGYTVEAREPVEGELRASSTVKQVFITTEGIEPGEEVADFGASTQVMVPVMVACVMQRPGTVPLAAAVLRRRQAMVQAVQRTMRDFAETGEPTLLRFIQEQPQLIEGYLVSITGVEVHYDLLAEEEL
ncbi:hypothetical protein L1280_002787 [Deinococcus sp. HSC-46F16]|uniref:hypothetical protein n=1 Tax=Deinococcus sp. HSC-46F16 TaxID=2910968 RepID=UPI00209E3F73|nr:hypothetical protein [Deinococcus sp. HSC-46F16]MCP2015619.1 hypothetical protein [Deinococcus sp. HSC-46F16]